MDKPVVKILTGIRRCGKSFLLKLLEEYLIDRGTDSKNIVALNFELLEHHELCTFLKLHEYVKSRVKTCTGKVYLLLDEIQEVEEWERAVNDFYASLDCDIFLTGSNAHLLSTEISTLLSGRFVEIRVFPLSFREFLTFSNTPETEKIRAFIEYMRIGGFPGLHFMTGDEELIKQYIGGIYSSVLLKDVVQRHNIRDTALLEKIMLYLMDNIGNIFSAKRISDFMKNQGRRLGIETIYNDLGAFQTGLLVYKVPRYDMKGKRILETMEKYYLSDHGLRYAVYGYRPEDISGILENMVFIELLRRGYSVHIGKIGPLEIDFIARRQDLIIYIQVCYLLATREVVEREYAPLVQIRDNYPKFVLSMDEIPIGNRDGIRWMNLREFLLRENDFFR
jgi:hypothetical protein